MNLADAIRQASKRFHSPTAPASALNSQSSSTPQEAPSMVNENRPPTQSLPIQQDMTPPAPDPAVVSSGGSVVRLEIFLSPEQMHQMLRGIIHGAHTVMTVREAAQHLRIKQKTLLEMAEKGEIPAFCVEGEWKFPRHAVDEWIATQTLISENSKGKSKEKNHAI